LNTKYIFLVGTAHQLAQVHDAIRYFSIDKEDAVLIIEQVGSEIINVSNIVDNFAAIYYFKSWVFSTILSQRKDIKDYIEICKGIEKNFHNVIFLASHYDSDSTLLFLSIVQPKNFFLLDEGTASFSVFLKRKSRNISVNIKLIIKSLLYVQKISIPETITYFTRFNIPSNRLDSILKYSPQKTLNTPLLLREELFFLGSSVSDIGLMEEHKYLIFLTSIYEKKLAPIQFYLPHRKESNSKLEKISDIGFIILKNNLPFELEFGSMNSYPGIISSFSCTAVLDNLTSMFEYTPRLIIFEINNNCFYSESEVFALIKQHMTQNKRLEICKI
jgi:hypothetical protein